MQTGQTKKMSRRGKKIIGFNSISNQEVVPLQLFHFTTHSCCGEQHSNNIAAMSMDLDGPVPIAAIQQEEQIAT